MSVVTAEQRRWEVEEVPDSEWSANPWVVKRPNVYDGRKLNQDGVHETKIMIGACMPSDSVIVGQPATDSVIVGQPATEASMEILKSIVYGGVMVVIASFSVVVSAAAAETPTMSIVTLALASVVGGIFAIGHNLWNLRLDCSQETNEAALHKYRELLGQINNFPLQAVFAILSFVVFGMVSPVVYGFSYHETNDKDYSIIAVAVVSLLCVSLLAILKAYITRRKGFFGYVKTVVYYVMTAVLVSGVSYVVGILVSRLIKELGLFDVSSGVATTPSLASF